VRIAIVHYWLLGMRGGERVIESLCRLLPDADIFTLFYNPEAVSPTIRAHKVTASFLNPLRLAYRNLLPLMPVALEHFDLRGYDLVLSSESGPAKGVIVPSSAQHVCYCHTPMRYLWDLYPDYVHEWVTSRAKRVLLEPFANYLRLWDFASAFRVDKFIANSANTQSRIWRCYRREAEVIHPPVQVETFYWEPSDDYYLLVAEMVAYKRLDAAIRTFSRNGRKLRVAGVGPEFRALRKIAGPNIEFCGRVSEEELRHLYARTRALVIPGEEDFGLTAVEALASGKPTIALGRGGVLETIPTEAPLGGVLYGDPSDEALHDAIVRFESLEPQIRPIELQAHATKFSESRFHDSMRASLPVVCKKENRL
jgi:glycosyltransferase involved in cell wall biosynthesis